MTAALGHGHTLRFMQRNIKLVHSPFTPNLETFDELVLMLFAPCSERMVTLRLQPDIQHYQAADDRPGLQIRNITAVSGRAHTMTLDLERKNVEVFEAGGKRYEIRLMRIEKQKIEGQEFLAFEFFASSEGE